MTILKSKISYIGMTGLFLTGILSSCSIPEKITAKEDFHLPEKYISQDRTDSLTIASLRFEDFFRDPQLTLLIEEVLAQNFDHKIAGEQMKIAEAYLRYRRGSMLPSLHATANASGTRYGKHTIEGVGNFDTNLSPNIDESQKVNTNFTPNYWLGLTANWEIDLWGKLRQMKKAAQKRFLATTHGRNLLRSALVTQTAILYYELITLDREEVILNENIALQKRALEVVGIQKSVGRATELAVQQFQAQLANTEAVLVEVQQQITATENQILALCGKYEGQVERGPAIDRNNIAYQTQHGLPGQLLQYRPDILAQYLELEASHADAKAVRAAFFPTVSLSAYAGYQSFNSAQLLQPTSLAYQLLGGLTAPVFQQNQLRSEFKIATARQEIAFLNYQKSVVHAFQEVRTLLSYIDNNQKILQLKSEEVASLTRSVDISNDLYVAAYAGYLEIISAQKSKIAADIDLIKAERNQVLAFIQLYKALGGGW